MLLSHASNLLQAKKIPKLWKLGLCAELETNIPCLNSEATKPEYSGATFDIIPNPQVHNMVLQCLSYWAEMVGQTVNTL